jgi:hypothetical protein
MGKEGRTSEDQKYPTWNIMEKNGCFAIGLATRFLNYRGHLQLIIFICCEC